jgi:hypothetical protein
MSAAIGMAVVAGGAPAVQGQTRSASASLDDGDGAAGARERALAEVLSQELKARIDVSSYRPKSSTVLTEAITLKGVGYVFLEIEVTMEELDAHRRVPEVVIDLTAGKAALARTADLGELSIDPTGAAMAARLIAPEATFCGDRAVVVLEAPVAWAGASWRRAVGVTRVLASIDEATGGDGGCPLFTWHENCLPATDCSFFDHDGFCFGGAFVVLCGCYPKL